MNWKGCGRKQSDLSTIPSLSWGDGGNVRMISDPAKIELGTSQIQVRNVTGWASMLYDFILKMQVFVNSFRIVSCFNIFIVCF
jgi:hypothetical protein